MVSPEMQAPLIIRNHFTLHQTNSKEKSFLLDKSFNDEGFIMVPLA
jgi:hypothetical protein